MLEFLQQLQLNDVINVNPGHLVFVDLQTLNSSVYLSLFNSNIPATYPNIVYKKYIVKKFTQPYNFSGIKTLACRWKRSCDVMMTSYDMVLY